MSNHVTQTELPRCPHCNVRRFENPNADPALSGMAHLCWKCVQPIYDRTDSAAAEFWYTAK